MKRLVVVRHAHAEQANGGSDRLRRLTSEGIADAKHAGAWLCTHVSSMDCIVTSDAARAVETARILAQSFDPPPPIVNDTTLYSPLLEDVLEVIWALEPRWHAVAIVGHNPSISDLVEFLLGCACEPLPPCGVVVLVSAAEKWSTLVGGSCVLECQREPMDVPPSASKQ